MILTTRDLKYLSGNFEQPKGSYDTPDRYDEESRPYCKCININQDRHWLFPCPACGERVRV